MLNCLSSYEIRTSVPWLHDPAFDHYPERFPSSPRINLKQSDWICCYVRTEFLSGLINLPAIRKTFLCRQHIHFSYKSLALFFNMRKWTKFGNLEMLGTWVNFNFLRSELFIHESFTCYGQGKQPDPREKENFCFFFNLSKYMRNEKWSSEETFDVTGARMVVRFSFSSHITGYKQPILPCYATLTAVKTLPVSV